MIMNSRSYYMMFFVGFHDYQLFFLSFLAEDAGMDLVRGKERGENITEGDKPHKKHIVYVSGLDHVTISPFWPCFWPSSFFFSHQVHALLKVTLQENNKNII